MATLTYTVTYGDWTATVNLNYSTSYAFSTNKTTITFSNCTVAYRGRVGFESKSDTVVTLTASDNTSSTGTVTLSTIEDGSGAAGGTVTYTATPNPTSLTLTHKNTTGVKKVNISAVTTVTVRINSTTPERPSNSTSPATTSVTLTTLYTLTLQKGSGTNLVVDLYSSPFRDPFSGFSSPATICDGEVLRVWGSASSSEAYENFVMNVSGVGNVTTGKTVPVNGNITVKTSADVKSFTLTASADEHSSVTVNRTSSPLKGASTGNLVTGSTIYYNDVLLISFSVNSGYEIAKSTVNDLDFVSGNKHTVKNNVTIKVASKLMGVVYIDNGTTIEKYLVYVDNGSSWDQYVPYVDDGSSWHICS